MEIQPIHMAPASLLLRTKTKNIDQQKQTRAQTKLPNSEWKKTT